MCILSDLLPLNMVVHNMVNYKSKAQLILRMKLTCNFRKLHKYSYITFENFIFMSHPQNYKTKISDILLQLNIECERIVTYQAILLYT